MPSGLSMSRLSALYRCAEHLPPYEIPEIVEFRDDVPLTATEKPWKKEVKNEVIARMKARDGLKKQR